VASAEEFQREEGSPMRTVVSNEGVDQLVARARNGDQVAWDRLVDRYGRMVWAVARAHGLGPADAGDVSQVTWLLLTQHLGSLGQPERLGVWLRATATREAVRMGRLRGREGSAREPGSGCRRSSRLRYGSTP
jgi:DNA-directed RNA polymerase specialized sigma24 family protein